jgi:hypothetical protein
MNFPSIFMPYLNLLFHNVIERAIKKEEQDGPGNDSEDSSAGFGALGISACSTGASIREAGTPGTNEGPLGYFDSVRHLPWPAVVPYTA